MFVSLKEGSVSTKKMLGSASETTQKFVWLHRVCLQLIFTDAKHSSHKLANDVDLNEATTFDTIKSVRVYKLMISASLSSAADKSEARLPLKNGNHNTGECILI